MRDYARGGPPGDWGGAPTEESVYAVGRSIAHNETDENTKVYAATSDEMFKELEALSKKETVILRSRLQNCSPHFLLRSGR